MIKPEWVHVGDPLYERHQLVLAPVQCLQVLCGPLTSTGGGENHGGDIVQPQQAGQVKREGLTWNKGDNFTLTAWILYKAFFQSTVWNGVLDGEKFQLMCFKNKSFKNDWFISLDINF